MCALSAYVHVLHYASFIIDLSLKVLKQGYWPFLLAFSISA